MEISNKLDLLPPELLPNIDYFFKIKKSSNLITKKLFDTLIFGEIDLKLAALKNTINLFSELANKSIEIVNDENESQQNRDNDVAFNIKRVRGNIPELLIIGILKTYYLMLENVNICGCTLTNSEWNLINHVFIVLLKLYNGISLRTKDLQLPSYSHASSPFHKHQESYERWVKGHYIFMVITQGLIITLKSFMSHLEQMNHLIAKKYFRYSLFLLKVTKIAFKFTGEFSQKSYNNHVRPTLMPPIAKPEMSGLYWRDHQYLIKKCFQPLKNYLANMPDDFSFILNEFHDVLSDVYKTHAYVCNKFVGSEQTSLRSIDSAVSVLERFRKSRLKLIKKQISS